MNVGCCTVYSCLQAMEAYVSGICLLAALQTTPTLSGLQRGQFPSSESRRVAGSCLGVPVLTGTLLETLVAIHAELCRGRLAQLASLTCLVTQ